VLVLAGEQGSAKSTLSAILRMLLDPNTAPLRALPREDRDLFIAANNGFVLLFDNVSGLPTWISDTLCRLATGGGYAVRALYTDLDEVIFDAQRPIILNGIEDVVSRPDLADRAIFVTLEPIPEEKRKPEAQVIRDFEAERPQILGALLDAVSHGLRRLGGTTLAKLPRMADFALWAVSCESADSAGAFMRAYTANIDAAVGTIIENNLIANAVRDFVEAVGTWSGRPKKLLDELTTNAGTAVRSRAWPQSGQALHGQLRRAAPALRKYGVEMLLPDRQLGTRDIVLKRGENFGKFGT
jgi:hypothetical protein